MAVFSFTYKLQTNNSQGKTYQTANKRITIVLFLDGHSIEIPPESRKGNNRGGKDKRRTPLHTRQQKRTSETKKKDWNSDQRPQLLRNQCVLVEGDARRKLLLGLDAHEFE